jgi:hypothetical protein
MTTDSKFEIAKNVHLPNDVFRISSQSQPRERILSAALLVKKSGTHQKCHEEAMREIYNQVISCSPTYTGWILLSNGGMVKSTRIVEYYGLWRGLEKNGAQLPDGQKSEEYKSSENGNIQFFGAIQLKNPDFSVISKLMIAHTPVHFVLSESSLKINKLLDEGWTYGSRKYPEQILKYVESESFFLIVPFGKFDDIESGAAIIATAEKISDHFEKHPV